MSSVLFTVFMGFIIRECNKRAKSLIAGYKNLQPVDTKKGVYADDIIIFAPTEEQLLKNLEICKK